MSVFSDAAKTGVLSAADIKQYANIPENGAFLAAAVAGGRTRSNIGFVITPGTTNQVFIEVRFLDRMNNLIPGVRTFDFYLSNSATGFGVIATAPDGTVQTKATPASPANGGQFFAYAAKRMLRVQTSPQGSYAIEITESTKIGYYAVVADPVSGLLAVSRQLVTADYG